MENQGIKKVSAEEYKKIRGEAERYANDILMNIPSDFTMLHLRCLKNIIPTEIDSMLSCYESRTKLS